MDFFSMIWYSGRTSLRPPVEVTRGSWYLGEWVGIEREYKKCIDLMGSTLNEWERLYEGFRILFSVFWFQLCSGL